MLLLKTISMKELTKENNKININKMYHFLTNNYYNLEEKETILNFDDFVFLSSFIFNDEEYNWLCVKHKSTYNDIIIKTKCKEFLDMSGLRKTKNYEIFDIRYYDEGLEDEIGDEVYRVNKLFVNKSYIYQIYPVILKEDDNDINLSAMIVNPDTLFIINESFESVSNKLLS